MAEACAVSHADSRRCLPAWMLKPCSSNEVSKKEDRNVQDPESDDQPGAPDQIKSIKRKSGKWLDAVDKDDDGKCGALQRCQGREEVARRKSKDADHDIKDENEEIKKITSNNMRKVNGKATPKNRRKRKLDNVESEVPSPGSTDDEVDLTVEDLVSIAEEIVDADKEKQQELQTIKAARQEEDPSCPQISTVADTGRSVLNNRIMKGLLQCTTTTTDMISTAAEAGGSVSNAQPKKASLHQTTSTNSMPSESLVDMGSSDLEPPCSSIKMTGDVAQDMLNIFFGPLLRKPAVYEKKSDAIESTLMNANQASEMKKSHSEVQRHGPPLTEMKNILREVWETKNLHSQEEQRQAPVIKKSSLKDKVALLL